MSLIEQLGLTALRKLDPERAHGLALKALHSPFAPLPGPVTSPRLATELAGLALPNPVGLAAGFDKNGTAMRPLARAGFGFIELGAVTPRPQPGNPKPRLFRLTEDRAAINRFGFNNEGMEVMVARLEARPQGFPIGLNLGANKDSADRAADFATVLSRCGAHLDFATVNVSSPNTEKLRDLQGADALTALLNGVIAARNVLERPIPVFLKIAPDLEAQEIEDIALVARSTGVDAIIATNTTLSRDDLQSAHAGETGGLSGAPLFEKSTRVLARLSRATEGQIPLIGVGGISTAEEAFTKITAGASAVQLYTAMVYHGISLAARIARGLDDILAARGYTHISQAIGTDREAWL
ncbi:quinone-dependent dihydroorotate dehydrogenase [Vannielia litorea]|uniref:quinone-dependent dihydroorotate dehydrogenase n=1 Tax=Vannielia litorea TaxID=1217970 RepID=UPI001C983BD2|nr:quinone-dependent dihydroorotate dehydrogenase [Vannielia litorea]MBY6050049.1 quinone-dependent dihydroorotate dehydrogenase [Vannielia litorea]MBY6077463.1 quinone-dependent dihydroorotate dehydrogenase [Vannielia litorea]